jgi:predicted phosphoribosyltransferase
MKPIYVDRQEAGKRLAELLAKYAGRDDALVLALPRGGVPVGYEIAEALGAPLDVYLVRKLGVPGHEELAMGALAIGGVQFLNHHLIRQLAISESAIEGVVAREQQVLQEQARTFRDDQPAPCVVGKTVILVDDGLATGATMAAAIIAVRQQNPAKIVVAVPVAPPDTCEAIQRLADEVVCGATPRLFGAVGLWYQNFEAVDDTVVRDLLQQARQTIGATRKS